MDEITTREALVLTGVPYFSLLRRAHKARVPHRSGLGKGRPILWNKTALLAALQGHNMIDTAAYLAQAGRYEAQAANLPEADPKRAELLQDAAELRAAAERGEAPGLGSMGSLRMGQVSE